MQTKGINHLALVCRDMAETVAFYTEALAMPLEAFLSDEEILELTYITCLYDMHAVMSRALRTEWDDRPDPIVEVEAPKGFSARDFLDTGRRPAR